MLITKTALTGVFPRIENPDKWVEELNKLLPEAGITTKEQVAMFLAQCGHESGGFTRFDENLNYSAKRLLAVFPKYFKSIAEAEKVANNPQKIANIIYANRMGNGNSESGDGWRYRGRGVIQLTGRSNYVKISQYLNDTDILTNPDNLNNIHYWLITGIWYWKVNNLANISDIAIVTKRINGGTIGLDERKKLYNQLMDKL